MTGRHSRSGIRTPTARGRLQPSFEEMHPSQVPHSTTKEIESGMPLGFVDMRPRTEPKVSHRTLEPVQETPTKAKGSEIKPPSSPGFEFKFTRKTSGLSAEAQKMMDDLRDEAAQAKATLSAQFIGESIKPVHGNKALFNTAGRKIAKVKGQAGRFSDVHKEQFKKMESIAGHASAFRAARDGLVAASTSLKRTQSRARLDEKSSPAQQSKSVEPTIKRVEETFETVSPTKRRRQEAHDDASAARPSSRDTNDNTSNGSDPTRSKPGLPLVAVTPTKASVTRSASVRGTRSYLPSLTRTPSSRPVRDGSKTDVNIKHLPSIPSIGRVRSILRRPQIFSTDDKEAAINAAMEKTPTRSRFLDVNKDLPSIPTTPTLSKFRTPTTSKRVNFSPSTIAKSEFELSPSVKTLAARSPSKSTIIDRTIAYPELPEPPKTTLSSPLRRPASGPGNFTFRAAQTITFGPASAGTPTSTIRAVRPSISGPSNPQAAISSQITSPTPLGTAIPHGLPNKKRRRIDSDTEEETQVEDQENREPAAKRQRASSTAPATTPKRLATTPRKLANPLKHHLADTPRKLASTPKRGLTDTPRKLTKSRPTTPRSTSKLTSTPKKGVLSMARLNALARPKERSVQRE
ncbi:MAG: hypothetical protein M1833_000553 [Piccolia ochrophora]|nr:MAG: hypothetical protein M1833_000553 [Piccolia ochrophora]